MFSVERQQDRVRVFKTKTRNEQKRSGIAELAVGSSEDVATPWVVPGRQRRRGQRRPRGAARVEDGCGQRTGLRVHTLCGTAVWHTCSSSAHRHSRLHTQSPHLFAQERSGREAGWEDTRGGGGGGRPGGSEPWGVEGVQREGPGILGKAAMS